MAKDMRAGGPSVPLAATLVVGAIIAIIAVMVFGSGDDSTISPQPGGQVVNLPGQTRGETRTGGTDQTSSNVAGIPAPDFTFENTDEVRSLLYKIAPATRPTRFVGKTLRIGAVVVVMMEQGIPVFSFWDTEKGSLDIGGGTQIVCSPIPPFQPNLRQGQRVAIQGTFDKGEVYFSGRVKIFLRGCVLVP